MSDDKLTIERRRYIGCKAKLTEWIMSTIASEAPEAKVFCDIFAGTAVIANQAIGKYSKVIINDFLFSNNLIYRAFFGKGEYSLEKLNSLIDQYNCIDSSLLGDNYFSINFGDKFFDMLTARKIGYIRQLIEDEKETLTDKEYCVLIATLIYNIDRIANTIGHYEAYVRKAIKPQNLHLRLIDFKSCDDVEIHQSDSNLLAREIKADVVYIDPPYNSRQYSRFYHLYETLVKWDMPELFGAAMKPKEENMSEYCSSRAPEAFADLISHIDAKYIFVSYNNTYHSKSSSSRNKISLEEILEILKRKGETKILEHAHQFFNAGKTDFDDHKELLFVTKVNG